MVAGPNGSGKSTLTRWLVSRGTPLGEYINPDEIATTLTGTYDDRVREAQRLADERRAQAIIDGRSFSFETVMSHASKVELLAQAKAAGFLARLVFVATNNPELNVKRVRQRVSEGGHDVPEPLILARYQRTLGLLQSAFDTADEAMVFDNSRPVGKALTSPEAVQRLVIRKRRSIVTIRLPVPAWLADHLRFDEQQP